MNARADAYCHPLVQAIAEAKGEEEKGIPCEESVYPVEKRADGGDVLAVRDQLPFELEASVGAELPFEVLAEHLLALGAVANADSDLVRGAESHHHQAEGAEEQHFRRRIHLPLVT